MQEEHSSMIMNSITEAAMMVRHRIESAASYFEEHAIELNRPFMLLKPKVFPDGDLWCVLYGESIQEGVCAFGETPAEAARGFDIEWINSKIPAKKQPSNKQKGLLDGLDMDAIKKQDDQTSLNRARYAGYSLEQLSDNYSDEERKAYFQGVQSREDASDIFERICLIQPKFPSI